MESEPQKGSLHFGRGLPSRALAKQISRFSHRRWCSSATWCKHEDGVELSCFESYQACPISETSMVLPWIVRHIRATCTKMIMALPTLLFLHMFMGLLLITSSRGQKAVHHNVSSSRWHAWASINLTHLLDPRSNHS